MRVETTGLRVERVRPRLDELEHRLRHLFFEGGRRIALTPAQREGLLRDGLLGARRETADGLWRRLRATDLEDSAGRLHASGLPTSTADAFAETGRVSAGVPSGHSPGPPGSRRGPAWRRHGGLAAGSQAGGALGLQGHRPGGGRPAGADMARPVAELRPLLTVKG